MKYAIAIDLGGTNIKAALVDENARIIKKENIPAQADKGAEVVLKNIKKLIHNFLSFDRSVKISGIGIGTPGVVDSEGKIRGAANISGWDGFNLSEAIRSDFNLPVVVGNDVSIITLGEATYGAGKGYKDIVLLALGTGIGGGIVIDGKTIFGHSGCAAEIGHMSVEVNGYPCNCGGFGCLEVYASATGIVRIAKDMAKKNQNTSMIKISQGIENITAKIVYDSAKAKDVVAMQVIKEVGKYLGVGIANLVNILNPQLVIIGGGVSFNGDILLDSVKDSLALYSLSLSRENVQVKLSQLGNDAGILGAACLVFQRKEKK
jgi:glucokinase